MFSEPFIVALNYHIRRSKEAVRDVEKVWIHFNSELLTHPVLQSCQNLQTPNVHRAKTAHNDFHLKKSTGSFAEEDRQVVLFAVPAVSIVVVMRLASFFIPITGSEAGSVVNEKHLLQ